MNHLFVGRFQSSCLAPAAAAQTLLFSTDYSSSRSYSRPATLSACRASSSSNMSATYEHELQRAITSVRLASRLCQVVQKTLLSKETQVKADQTPVTIADYGSQALVSWCLSRETPPSEMFSMVAEEDAEDLRQQEGADMLLRITNLVNETIAAEGILDTPILSKEGVLDVIDRGRSEGGASGKHWVLDPIDGTKGFVRGDQYAIALALLDKGEVVLGVLGCPNLPWKGMSVQSKSEEPVGCLFSAKKGAGTMFEPLDRSSPPQRVHVSAVIDPAMASFCESFEMAHSDRSLTEHIAKIMGVTAPPVRIDSQAKYAAMARGDATIYLRFPRAGYREKIWDHAAGSIVIEEAGGVVLDAAGRPLDFSKGRHLDVAHGILATNKNLVNSLLSAAQAAVKIERQS